MNKFDAKNLLLATTAICAASFFTNNANAEYTPTRGKDNAAYTVSEGTAENYDFYTINTSGEKEYHKYSINEGEYVNTIVASKQWSDTPDSTSSYGLDNNPNYYFYRHYYVGRSYKQYSSTGTVAKNSIGYVVNGNFVIPSSHNINNGKYVESTLYGGAVANKAEITSITGDFIKNGIVASGSSNKYGAQSWAVASGGAIGNGNVIGNITGDFIGNYVKTTTGVRADGGAIYNGNIISEITGNFIGNYSINTAASSSASGGAIYNKKYIGTIEGDFINNYVSSVSGMVYGGAIYSHTDNGTKITNINGNFIGNYVKTSSGGALGGAISGYGSTDYITGSFIGNYAQSSSREAKGGAVFNSSGNSISSVTGDFIYNYAKSDSGYAQGGAVFTEENITFVANTENDAYEDDILFKGNYVKDKDGLRYEAIYIGGYSSSNTTITFKSKNRGSYTFYDYINGNKVATVAFESDGENEGILNLYNNIEGQKTVNFKNKYVLNMISPSDIHEGTSALSYIQATNITISDAIQMAVDVDLDAGTMDHFEATNFTIASGGSITVNQFKIVAETETDEDIGETINIPFVVATNNEGLNLISTDIAEEIYGETYAYSVVYNNDGTFGFTKIGLAQKQAPAPALAAATATKTAGVAAGAATATVSGLGGQTMSHGGSVVSLGMNSGDEPLGLSTWVQAFGSNDDVELKHLSGKVDTQFYGLVGGIDSKRFTYSNGIHAVYGFFGAYVQGRQKLDDTKITQKSGYTGISIALRKDAAFSNFSLTAGFATNEANTTWGKDKFDTKIVSVANKTGTDLIKGSWALTPSVLLSYTGLDTDDYTAKSGTKVNNKFMNVFTVAPELKITRDLGDGLNGYAKVSYKFFFYDNNKIEANDVLMPAMSVKPYVEYGVGVTKDWSREEWSPKDLATFAEINRHDGGRTGWDVNLGMKLDF